MFKRLLFIVLICYGSVNAMAQLREAEANLKAAFIYNFIKYIDWSTPADASFIIGVIGPSPVHKSLQEIAKDESIDGKKIIVLHFNSPEDITGCNILFISANSPYSLSSILSMVSKGTLTISEEPGYATRGTAFNFVLVKDKLKFEANLAAIDAAGLKASSQLLKLALIVK
jgi:hypothetical protein